jgi:hypothetical protein
VAALTSMPLMKIAATKVEIERKESEVIAGLLEGCARRHRLAHWPLFKAARPRLPPAMAAALISTSGTGIDQWSA